jgi:hypothetical protein
LDSHHKRHWHPSEPLQQRLPLQTSRPGEKNERRKKKEERRKK